MTFTNFLYYIAGVIFGILFFWWEVHRPFAKDAMRLSKAVDPLIKAQGIQVAQMAKMALHDPSVSDDDKIEIAAKLHELNGTGYGDKP